MNTVEVHKDHARRWRTIPHLMTVLGLSSLAAPAPTVLGRPVPEPALADVRYGAHERNVMDVWLAPGKKPAPCVMIIHGGGWVAGDKRDARHDLTRYLDAGIAVVSINYRYLPQTIIDSGSSRGTGPVLPRGDYPEPPVREPLEDAARALQFIRHHAPAWNIDPARVAVSGGSAGGCSALWLAFHDDLAEPGSDDPVRRQSTKPRCAATTGAQTSLDPQQVREWIPNTAYGMGAFGFVWDKSDPTVEFRSGLRHRDEVLPWIKKYSPYELVTKDDPPVYLHYSADSPQRGQVAADPTHNSNYGALLAEKLEALGLDYEFVHRDSRNPIHASCADYLIAKLQED